MKNFTNVTLPVILLLLGFTFATAQAPEDLPTVQKDIDPFNELELNGVFHVYLSQGDQEALYLEADHDILPHILVRNEGNRLVIERKNNINPAKLRKYNIFITIKDLAALDVNGVGRFRCREILNLHSLRVHLSGIRGFELQLKAERLEADFSGIGRVTLIGEVGSAHLNFTGIGKLDAYDLKVGDLTIDRTGIGKAEVFASESLKVANTGIGSVRYLGTPRDLNTDSAAIGRIKAKRRNRQREVDRR